MITVLLMAAALTCGPGPAEHGAQVQVAVFMSLRPELVRQRCDHHTVGTSCWSELRPGWETIGMAAAAALRASGLSAVLDGPDIVVGSLPSERWRWAERDAIVDPPRLIEVCIVALPAGRRLDDLLEVK